MNINQTQQKNHEISNPATLYDPTDFGYSHVATVPPNSTMIYVSGQGGGQHKQDTISNFRSQVRQAFENLKLALASQESSMQDIVKLTTLVVNHNKDKHQVLIEESQKHWPDKDFPTQSLIPVARLAVDGMLFEVEAVAAKPQTETRD
jgi:enamine deaminase RidA (YjgF/YER057c/UK114 family)